MEAATAALHRFDAEMGREIAPFSAVLLRSESASSSQIERITASARAIARAELGDESRANAAAIVANTRAMQAAIRLADNVDLEAILAMHAALMESSRDSEHAGVIRTEQVWIGGDSLSPAGAEFVPPHHESLPPLLADLVQFVARTDIPTLAHAAIAHAQFETIHPFVDGNGRTGRALIHAMLRAARVSRHVSFPISAGLLAEIGTYFDSLTAYRAGDAGPIVEQFVDASYRAVENGRALVDDLEQIRSAWRETVQVRDGSRAWDVADLMLQRPAVDVALLRSALGIRAENVARALAPLVDAGIVRRFGGGRAGVVYEAPAVFDALDAFARRAGRRQIRGR
ncbi:MAG: Fic family protein [bacterium]|nr:Fic family protein [bacterium]